MKLEIQLEYVESFEHLKVVLPTLETGKFESSVPFHSNVSIKHKRLFKSVFNKRFIYSYEFIIYKIKILVSHSE